VSDRAHVVATTILAIVVEALRAWLSGRDVACGDVHARIAQVLRDEFEDIAAAVRDEVRPD